MSESRTVTAHEIFNNNQVTLELYHKAGFVETGEEDDEEIELSQRLA